MSVTKVPKSTSAPLLEVLGHCTDIHWPSHATVRDWVSCASLHWLRLCTQCFQVPLSTSIYHSVSLLWDMFIVLIYTQLNAVLEISLRTFRSTYRQYLSLENNPTHYLFPCPTPLSNCFHFAEITHSWLKANMNKAEIISFPFLPLSCWGFFFSNLSPLVFQYIPVRYHCFFSFI